MPIVQFTDQQYKDLAAANGIPESDLDHYGAELRRVHRLLTVDGYNLDRLNEYERNLAECFTGMALTSMRFGMADQEDVIRVEAFEVDQLPERPHLDTPEAECARRVRAASTRKDPLNLKEQPVPVRELCPEIDKYFYWQIQQAFPQLWRGEQLKLMAPVDGEIEQLARANHRDWQDQERLRHAQKTVEQLAECAEKAPENLLELQALLEKKRREIERGWDQLSFGERDQYRRPIEDRWFVTGIIS